MKKTIIIMAKSNKHSNYCVAGIDVDTGAWIRPISNNIDLEGAVLLSDATYSSGKEIEIFDIVEIEFIKHSPSIAQCENYLYDSGVKWKQIGKCDLDYALKVKGGFDKCDYIFFDNEKLIDNETKLTGSSLLLVPIINPFIFIKTFQKKRIQLNFNYNEESYNYIRISDTSIIQQYQNKSDGLYALGNNRIAVFSLTDKYALSKKYYKMLAQLF